MGGEKSSEHREDGHDPPPGCAGATVLALARDCRFCARGGAGASLLVPLIAQEGEGKGT